MAFVGVKDVARARAFYRDTLGLTLESEDDFALVFDAYGTPLRVSIVPELVPAMFIRPARRCRTSRRRWRG